MFAKLCVVILGSGVVACSLLALRQQRLQAAHELAEAQLRLRSHDERLWRLRGDIASRTTPDQTRALLSTLGEMKPLLPPGAPSSDAGDGTARDEQRPSVEKPAASTPPPKKPEPKRTEPKQAAPAPRGPEAPRRAEPTSTQERKPAARKVRLAHAEVPAERSPDTDVDEPEGRP
ncbi:MAG: hypothetical protein SFZ23_08385 [Planctomycetota bacterium]|nr:hypothetical protein [Planctomycetota bacterium]